MFFNFFHFLWYSIIQSHSGLTGQYINQFMKKKKNQKTKTKTVFSQTMASNILQGHYSKKQVEEYLLPLRIFVPFFL